MAWRHTVTFSRGLFTTLAAMQGIAEILAFLFVLVFFCIGVARWAWRLVAG